MMQAHMGYDPDPELLASLPLKQRALLSGSDKYQLRFQLMSIDHVRLLILKF